jgi:hypothetical protein
MLQECEKGREGVDYGMRFRRIHEVMEQGGRLYENGYYDRDWVVYV